MTINRNDWFPTPIWNFTLDNHPQLNSILLAEVNAEQQFDRVGEKWSNILGWHSVNDLHKRDSFNEFTKNVDRNVLEVATFLQ